MNTDNLRMVRVGDRIINLTQITFAEYTPAFTPPALGSADGTNPNHHPITYTRPDPKPSCLLVHFVGGETHQFFGELADELNAHFDLLV
jgi:hypothetical protein